VPAPISEDAAVDVDVITETTIAREPAEVARYAADPSNAPEWYANIDLVEWRTDPPARVGSRIAFVARFLGRRLSYTYEIAEVTEHRLVMRTAEGPFPMETTYTWEPIDGGTLMTLRNQGSPAGFSRLLAPVMQPSMRRANRKDLAALKQILERGRSTT
jgi:Polyketide cyclase / dehydrase and lipid transport